MRRISKFGNKGLAALAIAIAAPMALNACSVNGGSGREDASAEAASDDPSPTASPAEPVEMAETAWSASDSDGAVYTTFIDPNGTYRDFRDGVRNQTGSWEMPDTNRICYRPDNAPSDEDGGTCWTVGKAGRDGVMTAINTQGNEVVVRKVKYVPPQQR